MVLLLLFPTVASASEPVALVRHQASWKGRSPIGQVQVAWLTVGRGVAPALRTQADRALGPKAAFGESLAEMHDNSALEKLDYRVLWNRQDLVSVQYHESTVAAYPDEHDAYLNLDARTGRALRAQDLFRQARIPGLIRRLDALVQARKKQALRHATGENLEALQMGLGDRHFGTADLNRYSIGADSITFHFDWGFVHAVKALEPAGDFTVRLADLRADLLPGGPLTRLR